MAVGDHNIEEMDIIIEMQKKEKEKEKHTELNIYKLN